MKHRNITLSKFYVGLAIFSLMTSCKKFVEIEPPTNQLVETSTFSSNATATAALTSIYSQIVTRYFFGYRIPLYTGLSSDELTNHSSLVSTTQCYTNSLTPVNDINSSGIFSLWTNLYNGIYQANAVIDGVGKSGTLTDQVRKQLDGEAKFLRAFMYFYLVNLWGEVPLITSTDYTKNAVQKRNSIDEVYNQIILDLQNAEESLSDNYVDKTNMNSSEERIRPNKWAASALLARVYLYMQDWEMAETLSSKVIENTALYELQQDVTAVFLKNNHEAIWQLMMAQPNSMSTAEGAFFILTSGPATSSDRNSSTISSQLLSAFQTTDSRRLNWIDSVIVDGNTYYFPGKYNEQYNSDPVEYSTVIRLAELYLIRAEARAQQGKLTEAVDDLNVIRSRAGIENSTAVDVNQLLIEITTERQLELFTEWGHRWLDLKRTMAIDSVMNNVTPLKGGEWKTTAALFPIPQNERDANPNISQNAGY